MKTLVLLTALVSVTLAAPSYFGRENIKTNSESWPKFITRDKKSPKGYFFAESTPFHFAGPPVHANSELDGSLATGRSFGFKKPLKPTIIKKHNGYHVYRDSDEERAQADPNENCLKQVNFKFCDGSHKEGAFARSSNDKTNAHGDDVQSRIKMAKEAIENIQRDLKNIEESPKSAGWNQGEAGSQAEFQEDIVAARKELDQVNKNFGNLESMSLHVEPSHQGNDKKVSRHQERMAQWKENIESIQKNIDVGINIEDISEPVNQPPDFSPFDGVDTTNFMRNTDKSELKLDDTFVKGSRVNTKQDTFKTPVLSELSKDRHASIETKKEKGSIEDLKVSETALKETQTSGKAADSLTDIQSNLGDKKHIGDSHGRSRELNINNPITEDIPISMKAIDHKDIEFMEKKSSRTSESNKEKTSEKVKTNNMKAAETHLEKEEIESEKHPQKIEKEHSDSHLNKLKSSGPDFENKFDHVEEKEQTHFETAMKSAEHENVLKTSFNVPTIHIENQVVSNPLKSIVSPSMRWAPINNGHIENEHELKAAEEHRVHEEDLKGMHLNAIHHHTAESSNHVDKLRGHAHTHHHTDSAVESSNHDDTRRGHAHTHHHTDSAAEFSNHDDTRRGHAHKHSSKLHRHEHLKHHAKSADIDGFMQPTLQTNLPDFMGKSALENMLQWAHKQDDGRSAYGAASYGAGSYGSGSLNIAASSGGGYGAVGVFPNAHVGGCAVPLLLSCSPSVVSGSLAKSGYGSSSYGSAPAYKSTDENVQSKRDIKKTNEISSQKLTHKKTITQKPKIIEKKL